MIKIYRVKFRKVVKDIKAESPFEAKEKLGKIVGSDEWTEMTAQVVEEKE